MTGPPERVLIGVRLPVPLARRLKVTAAQRGTSVQALVEAAIRAFLGTGRRPSRGTK
jgi:plasmid stability protein